MKNPFYCLLLFSLLTFCGSFSANAPVAVKSFRNVPQLRSALASVGIGPMRKWWSDGMGWMSASNYYEFGPAVSGALYDNLALYLESDSESYVRTLKMNLTAFHKSGPQSAYLFMAQKTPLLFKAIQLPVPPGLLSAVKSKKVFSYSAPSYQVQTDWDAGVKAESYRLIIISK